jgi:competence protein ComEC
MLLGLAAAAIGPPAIFVVAASALVLGVLASGAALRRLPETGPSHPSPSRTSTSFTLALAACLGASALVRARAPPEGDDFARRLGEDRTRVVLRGTIDTSEPPAPDGRRLVLDADSWRDAAGGHAGRARVRVFVTIAPGVALPDVHPGDRVEVAGLAERPPSPTNPGAYDLAAAWSRQDVHARLTTPDARCVRVLSVSDSPLAWISRARDAVAASFTAAFSPEDGGLLRSLLLGDRGALSDADRERFRVAGAAHILAISGAHVALIAAAVALVLRRAGFGPRRTSVVLAALVLLYVPFSGSAPPVVRSAAGALLFLAGRALGREPTSGTLLAAVAAGYLTLDPREIDDPGFRLSFAAALGMVLLARPLLQWIVPERPLAPGIPSRPRSPVRAALAVGTAGWLASTPVSVHDLGQMSFAAVPVGLVAVPLSSIGMGLGALALALGPVPLLGSLAHTGVDGTLWLLRAFLDLPGRAGLGQFRPLPPGAGWYVVYVAGFLAASRARAWTAAAGAATVSLCLASLSVDAGASPPSTARLTLLDVGHGQAALLETPDGRRALLDAGSRDRPDPADRIVLPALQALRVPRLDLAVASHADADHWGALPGVLAAVPTETLALPPSFPHGLRADLSRHVAHAGPASDGDVLLAGPWGRLLVLGPAPPSPARAYPRRSTNDGCLVLLVETPHGSVLLPGDRETTGVADLLAAHPDLRADVLVLPHHGLPSPGRDRLVDAVAAPIRLASAPATSAGTLPVGTRSTAREGALVVDLQPGGPRVTAPWAPPRFARGSRAPMYDPARAGGADMNDPLQLLVAAATLTVVALLATRLRWLTPAGAAGAGVLGLAAVYAFSWAGLAALLAPFLVATLLGRLPRERAAGDEPPRTLRQVTANGLVSLLGAGLAAAGWRALGAAVFAANLANLGADTVATEIGVRYGGTPRSLATGRRLPSGESGGVTFAGTSASIAGAALAPVAFALCGGVAAAAILPLGVAGFAGGLADSLLGATVQRKGTCPTCGTLAEEREHCGVAVPTAGRRPPWLDNDAVNLLGGAVAAVVAGVWLA